MHIIPAQSSLKATILLGLFSLLRPTKAVANIEPITIEPKIGFQNLSQAINTVMTAAMFFGALAALAFIVIGAIKYVTAGDDATAVAAARKTIINAVAGLIVLAAVYVMFAVLTQVIPNLEDVFSIGASSGSSGALACNTQGQCMLPEWLA